jgi:hypothetical protein
MLDGGHFRARRAAFRKLTTARGDGGGRDTSIVNIGFPSIARTFHSLIGGAVERVIIAYLTVVAATLLTFGRLSPWARSGAGPVPEPRAHVGLAPAYLGLLWLSRLPTAPSARSSGASC